VPLRIRTDPGRARVWLFSAVDELQGIALLQAGPDRQVRKGTGDAFGQFLHARALGGVVAGKDQSHVKGLCLEGAVESCLAGQQDIGPGLHGIAQKVVTRSTRDGHVADRLPGIADHLHTDVAQSPRDEDGELLKAPGLPVMADAAGTGARDGKL